MTHTAWLERWQQGRIGFHRSAPHESLIEHWPALGLQAGQQVLVPLCGKSEDMRWLATRGHSVLGVELSPLAIDQFVAEGDASVLRQRQSGFECTRQGRIELWCGDFFHFHAEHATELTGFYDRAALIALPSPMRRRYAHHLAQLMTPGSRGLLITLTHQAGDKGPPFHVPPDEVERLLGTHFDISLRETAPIQDDGVQESVWQLERRGPER